MIQSFLTTIFFIILNTVVFGQDLTLDYSKFSDCFTTNLKSNKILSENVVSDTLSLQLELILNCSVDSNTTVDFKLKQDTLHLFISESKTTATIFEKSDTTVVKTDSKMNKDGQITTYSTVTITSPTVEIKHERALCDCTYVLNIRFKNANQVPKSITVNNILLTKAKLH